MSHKLGDDGSVTYDGEPSEEEREKARKAVEREKGTKETGDKGKRSHPRTKASKESVGRETGTKNIKETELPPMPA